MANNFVTPRLLLCDLLAASPAYRTAVNQATSALASATICSPYAGDDSANSGRRALVSLPRAIINRADEWDRDKIGIGWGRAAGNLALSLQFLPDPTAGGDPSVELDRFEEVVGDIIEDLANLSAKDMAVGDNVRSGVTDQTHLNVTKISVLACGEGESKNEAGQIWYGAIILVWYV